jgi:Flp pilus assembly protein TadG
MTAFIRLSRERSEARPLSIPSKERDGNTAVEFALLMPVFLLMFLGVIEFGRLLWTQVSLQHAVEAAARCAAVTPSQCDATTTLSYAADEVFGQSVASSAFSVTSPSPSCGTQVKASLLFSFVVPALFPYNITLSAQSCYPS